MRREVGEKKKKSTLTALFTLWLNCCLSKLSNPSGAEFQFNSKYYTCLPDAQLLSYSTITKSPSLANSKKPLIRTRRSDQDLYSSSQFFSAENFSSLTKWEEPVEEIPDQRLIDLGFPIPTRSPPPVATPAPVDDNDHFHMKETKFFVINSREYALLRNGGVPWGIFQIEFVGLCTILKFVFVFLLQILLWSKRPPWASEWKLVALLPLFVLQLEIQRHISLGERIKRPFHPGTQTKIYISVHL